MTRRLFYQHSIKISAESASTSTSIEVVVEVEVGVAHTLMSRVQQSMAIAISIVSDEINNQNIIFVTQDKMNLIEAITLRGHFGAQYHRSTIQSPDDLLNKFTCPSPCTFFSPTV